MRGATLETKRLALTLAYWQPILVIFGAFAFDLRGAPALALVGASLLVAVSAGIASWILSLVALCPNCGNRYFSIIPLLFLTSRRCTQCGLRDSEREPPQKREA